MSNYKLYSDEIEFSVDDVVINNSGFVKSINLNLVRDLVGFFKDSSVYALYYQNDFSIVKIDINDAFIIGDDEFDGTVEQKFGVRKSYVATVDKNTIDGVINFYSMIKKREFKHYVFDYSKETVLQGVLENNDNVENINQEDIKESRVKEKKQGKLGLIILGIIAAIMLTIMSVMISIKILGIR